MGTGYKNVSTGLAFAVVSAISISPVMAQQVQVQPVIVEPATVVQPVIVQPAVVRPVTVQVRSTPVPLQPGTIPYQFLKEFYSHDGNYMQNRSFLRQLAFIFGPYPENEITRDVREVNQLYNEVLSRQMATGPILRTADLPSPFTQTVGTLPAAEAITPPLPVQPPVFERTPPVVTPPVVTPAPQPDSPVPALW